MKPRSDKRAEQEKEYAKRRKIVIAEQYNCFFCGEKFRKNYRPDIHHLKGRDNELLTDKRYLVAVHRKCHREYHDKSRCKIEWYPKYLVRLKQRDFELWQHEVWLSEK